MIRHLPNTLRDQMITAFRYRICEQCNIVPFKHQAEWWAASDGTTLTDIEDENGMEVRVGEKETKRFGLLPRIGGRARVLADLGAFKTGKSFGAGVWAASFAAVPNAKVQLVGLIYDICVPEFEYIAETLLSERGLNLPYKEFHNRPRNGQMWLLLENDARFEARSWDNKESLKGKEIDAYVYCEAYQLPGIECYSNFSQNLDAREGYAVFATTPDRPWLKELHDAAHSGEKEFDDWHCTCNVPRSQNVFTYNAKAAERDKGLMTKDQYQIHHLGQLGEFVGSVYGYQRGDRVFGVGSHPFLFQRGSKASSFDYLRIPEGWEVVGGMDTGTFMSAVIVAFSPEGDAYVVWEAPNYRYVGGKAERDNDQTIPVWSSSLKMHSRALGGQERFWADRNSQFKAELRNYGVHLLSNRVPFETRTAIAQEYFVRRKIFFAPWLSVLPFEVENAEWPPDTSASGRYQRLKDRDHTLDGLEHILSRRPVGGGVMEQAHKSSWGKEFAKKFPRKREYGNVHIGR